MGFGEVVDRFSRARPVAADGGIGFTGEVVMPWVVGSGQVQRLADS